MSAQLIRPLAAPFIARRGLLTGAAALAAAAALPRDALAASIALSQSDKHSSITVGGVDNLRATGGENNWRSVRATGSVNTGKKYIEALGGVIGWASSGVPLTSFGGADANGFTYHSNNQCWKGGVNVTSWDVATSVWQLLSYDADAGTIWGTKWDSVSGQGTWKGASSSSGDPAAGTNGYDTGFDGATRYPITSFLSTGGRQLINFGARPALGTIPSGFSGLDTANFAAYPAGVTAFDTGASSTGWTVNNNGLRALRNTSSSSNPRQIRADKAMPTGAAALFEFYILSGQTGGLTGYRVGMADTAATVDTGLGSAFALQYDGAPIINGTTQSTVAALAYDLGDVVSVFVNTNPSVKKVWFAKNGVFDGNPSAGTGGYDISGVVPSKTIVPAMSATETIHYVDANFGSYAFTASMPTGGVSYDDAETSIVPRTRIRFY